MKKQIVFGIITLASSLSVATPLKDAACAKNLKISHPQGSSGVYFSEDCKTGYVLPPALSDVAITSMVGTAHAKSCGAFNKLAALYEKNANLLDRLTSGFSEDEEEDQGAGTGSELDSLLAPKKEKNGPTLDEGLDEMDRRTQLIEKYLELAEKTEKLFQNYENKPAASATVTFRVPWDDLVNHYQNANSGVTFVRMPLTNAYITFNRVISKVGTAPALLDYDIPGVGAKDVSASAHSTTLLSGDAYSGQIMLSMVGACPFYREDSKSLVRSVRGQSLTAYLNANMNFNYQLQVTRNYTVKYNLGLLVKRIHERSSSGGFFSTSSHVKEINESSATNYFQFINNSNDARFNYDIVISELKAEVMNMAIRDIAMMAGFTPENAPQVIARTKNGAQVGAEALQKCPNQYCQIGALGLQALDAIFGNDSSTSTYINNRNSEIKQDVVDNKMLEFSGTATFVYKKPSL